MYIVNPCILLYNMEDRHSGKGGPSMKRKLYYSLTLLLLMLLALVAAPAAAEEAQSPQAIQLEIDPSTVDTVFLDSYGSEAYLAVQVVNWYDLTNWYGTSPSWTLSGPNGEESWFTANRLDDMAIYTYNNSATEACDFTLELTCTWGDLSSSIELPMSIRERPEALKNTYYTDPVLMVLGDTSSVPLAEICAAEETGINMEDVRIGSYSYSENCIPYFDEDKNCILTASNSGTFNAQITWYYSNLEALTVIPIAIGETAEDIPQVSSITLSPTVYFDDYYTVNSVYGEFFRVYIDDYNTICDLYGTNSVWDVRITGDDEQFIHYDNYGSHMIVYVSTPPTHAAEITVDVTCTLGNLTDSYTHQISVYDQEIGGYPSVAYVEPIITQVGQTFTLNAQELMCDASWSLPTGEPSLLLEFHNDHGAITLDSRTGTDFTWMAHQSGAYKANLCWRWANYTYTQELTVIVANEDGSLPDIEPEFSGSIYTPTLFVNGNEKCDSFYLQLDNFSALDALYGLDAVTWSIGSISGTDARFELTNNEADPSWGHVRLVSQPTAAGEAEVVVHVDFDYEDDSRNFTYAHPFTFTIEELPIELPESILQLPDVVVDPGEEFTIDQSPIIPEEIDNSDLNVWWHTFTSPYLNDLGCNNYINTYTANEPGVFRQTYQWLTANISGSGYADVYVRNSDGSVDALPVFEIVSETYMDTLYVDGHPSGALAFYTVPNTEAVCRYFGCYQIDWTLQWPDGERQNFYGTYRGEHNKEFSLYLNYTPESVGTLGCEVVARCNDVYLTKDYTATVAANPGFVEGEIVTPAPIRMVIGQPLTVPAADLLPEAFDPELFTATLEQQNNTDYLECLCENNEVTLTAFYTGVYKVTFNWSVEHYRGSTEVIFLVGEDEDSIPDLPEFRVEEQVDYSTLYIGGNTTSQFITWTVPDAENLYNLYGDHPYWEVSIENDPEGLLYYGYEGDYSERLYICHNYPSTETELVINVSCEFNGEHYSASYTVPVLQGPDHPAYEFVTEDPITLNLGQTLSLDAQAALVDWSLDAGTPTLELNNISEDVFKPLGQEGSVVSWKPLAAGAYRMELRWSWCNYYNWFYPIVVVNDEDGNPPTVMPEIDPYLFYDMIYTNGNNDLHLGQFNLDNYQALSKVDPISDVEWIPELITDTGLTLRYESGSNYLNYYLDTQPTSAGTATLNVTAVVHYDNDRPSDTITESISFEVQQTDLQVERFSVIHREYMNAGDTCTIDRASLLDQYQLCLSNTTQHLWLRNWNINLMEDTGEYFTFQADAPGLYSAEFFVQNYNFERYCMVYFFVAAENGNYPEVPVFDVEHTREHNTVYVGGNNDYLILSRYKVADANTLPSAHAGQPLNWYVDFDSDLLAYNFEGDDDITLRVFLNNRPTEACEATARITAFIGGQRKTFTETFTIAEGPETLPTDLAADQVLLCQEGATFSIDAAALADGWTLDAEIPSLELTQNTEYFEFVGAQGSVYTWKALESGVYDLSFDWRWSNYSTSFFRTISVADENGVYPGSEPEFTSNYYYDTLYTEGNCYVTLGCVALTNYDILQKIQGYDSYGCVLESVTGSDLGVNLVSIGDHSYEICMSYMPTIAADTTVNLLFTFYKGDEAVATEAVPVTFTVKETPFEVTDYPCDLGVLYAQIGEEFSLNNRQAIPAELAAIDATGTASLDSFNGPLSLITNDGDTITFRPTESGLAVLNFSWHVSTHIRYSNMIVCIADENGIYPEIPNFSVDTQHWYDTVYIGGNQHYTELATYTVHDLFSLSEIYGTSDVAWSMDVEGDTEYLLHNSIQNNGEYSQLTLYAAGHPSTEATINVSITARLGARSQTITETIQVVDGPDYGPQLLAKGVHNSQIGSMLVVDAQAFAEDWSLSSGIPTLELQVATEDFELISVEGTVYTYRVLNSGILTPTFFWRWANYTEHFAPTIISADENGVVPTLSAEFNTPYFHDFLFTNGNDGVNFADVNLINYDAIDAMYDIEQVSWEVGSIIGSDMTVHLSKGNTYAFLHVDDQPTYAGNATVEILCTIDCAGSEHDMTYIVPVAIPIVEADYIASGECQECGSIIANENEMFSITKDMFVPESMMSYADNISVWLDSHSDQLSLYDSSNGILTFQSATSGVYYVKLQWGYHNVYGYSKFLVQVADAQGNVPEIPTFTVTEDIKLDTLYLGGYYPMMTVASYTIENAQELCGLYGTSPAWNYEGSAALHTSIYNNGSRLVVSRNLAQLEDTTPLEYTVTCTFGEETKTFTHTVQVLENPNTFLPGTFADTTPIRTQVGQTFTIDASALQDGWSLPTGVPEMTLQSNTDAFELVSKDGSLYTYRALQSGAYSNLCHVVWANFDFHLTSAVIVADENGVYPTVEPEFESTCEWSTIFVNGNYGYNFANFNMVNYEAICAMYGETTLSWAVDCTTDTGAAFYVESWDAGTNVFVLKQPEQAGSIDLVVTCTIDCAEESVSGTYEFPITLTAIENPGAELDERVFAYSTTVSPSETFYVDTSIAVMPPELDGIEGLSATYSNAGHSNALTMEGPDRFTAPGQSGVYRVDYQWHIANLCGYRYVDVYVTDANGNVPEMPELIIEIVTPHEALYTGGNELVDIVSFVVEDYYALHAYYPDSLDFRMNWVASGTELDIITQGVTGFEPFAFTYSLTGSPSQVGFYSFDAIAYLEGEVLCSSGWISIPVLEGPDCGIDGLDPAGALVMEPGGTFTIDASQLMFDWTLPQGTPTLELLHSDVTPELISVDGSRYTWRAPEQSGIFNLYFIVQWTNYSIDCHYSLVVADEDGNIPQPEVRFAHSILSNPIFVNGNSNNTHIAYLTMSVYSQPALEVVYGFDSVVWEITSVEGSDATFRFEQWGSDTGYLFIVDQPTYAGTATINADCVLMAADNTVVQRIPTSISIDMVEWTDDDAFDGQEYGPYVFDVNEVLSLHYSEYLPESVDWLEGAWDAGVSLPDGLECVDFDEHLQILPTKAGKYTFTVHWNWRNIAGSSIVHLHIADENGVVPPTVNVTETKLDDKVYIEGPTTVDLMRFELENAAAVADYAGSDVNWIVTVNGDPEGVLHTETSGDRNEMLLITTDFGPSLEETVTVNISCEVGSLGVVYSAERTVEILHADDDTQPVLTLTDPIETQLGQTFTIDAIDAVGGWTLPTGAPTLVCMSDKVELVSHDGNLYTFRALESGAFDAAFTWRWNTYYQYNFTSLIVCEEDGTLPLITPDIERSYISETVYIGGNCLINPVTIRTLNLDTLNYLYDYDLQWEFTSNTGFEEFFTLDYHFQNYCYVTLVKQPDVVADFELELKATFDAEDDQYDQTIFVTAPVSFAELENPPVDHDEKDLPIQTVWLGERFTFTQEDILPQGYTLPDDKPWFEAFDHFDMHDRYYTDDGSWSYTARESGLFRMGMHWRMANYQGMTYVNLYVAPDNTDCPYMLYTDRGINRTIYADGDRADTQRLWIAEYEPKNEAQWSLRHVYGTDFGYKLNVDADHRSATISMADLPEPFGFAILELTCEVDGYSWTQPIYIRSTTLGSNKPTWLNYHDEYDVLCGQFVGLSAYCAHLEGAEDYWEGGEHQNLYVVESPDGIQVYYYTDMLDIIAWTPGTYTLRLRWECSNLVLYKDITINATTMLPEDIRIRESDIKMLPGMSYQLHLTDSTENAVTVWWWTDDESIARLDDNGVLTAVSEGTTRMTISLFGTDESQLRLFAYVHVLPDLTTMTLPASLTTIDDEAFYGSAAGYVIIPSGVTSIGDSAFASMPNLQLVSIPSTVTSFGDNCLNGDSAAILCEEGSAAESYAVQEGIPYFIVK